MDCDLTHEPKYISIFLKLYKKYDFLVGSRYINKESLARWALWRILLSYTAHYVCLVFLNIRFDTTSGFRMYYLMYITPESKLMGGPRIGWYSTCIYTWVIQ